MKKDRLDHLDGIRGLAAFSVMLCHVHWPSAIAHLPFWNGATLWVDFFFVLSGFVIARSYFDRLAEGFSIGRFMWKRFARLYPLHLVTLLAALLYELVKWKVFGSLDIEAKNTPFAHNNLFSFVCTALLIHSLGIFPATYWNGTSWSISVEFFSYLVFAICVALSRSRRVLFWVLLGALQVLSFVVLARVSPERTVEADYGFFRCVLGFGLGVIVEHFCRGREIPACSPKNWLNVPMALVILVMVSTPTEGTLLPLLAPFVFAVAIWLLVQYRGGLVERLLMARVCQTLGLLSYSIYMTHLFFHGLLRNGWRVLSKHAFFQSGWGASLLDEGLTLALIAIVLLVSRFTYRKVEIPAQRWLNQLADRPRRAPVPAVEVAA